jgi:hypothetical protein
MAILRPVNEAATTRDHRHHLNSQQPRAVVLVYAYPYPVPVPTQPAPSSRRPPALLPTTVGAPVVQRRPDNNSDDAFDAKVLCIVRMRVHLATSL